MKNLVYILGVFLLSGVFLQAQEKECNKNYKLYERFYNNKDYKSAYPIWKKELEQCPTYVVNIYNHATVILPSLIETAQGAEKEQYINDLFNSFELRFKNFPENKNMYEGDLISYKLEYGKIDSLQAQKDLAKIFNNALSTNTKISFYTLNTFFNNTLTLYYYNKLNNQQYIDSYDLIKKAIKLNVDIRNEEKAPIEDKLYGKTDSLGNVIVPPQKLTYEEKQIFENDSTNIAFFTRYDSIYAVYFNQYMVLDCEQLTKLVNEGFQSHYDDGMWMARYYYLMQDADCENEAYAKVNKRVLEIYANKPSSGGAGGRDVSEAPSGCGSEAYSLERKGQLSSAIEKYKCAINETNNNNTKANYAAKIASLYSRQNSFSNAKNWAFKALDYKPGYNSAYLILADIYYRGAAQVPGNSFAQRAAGWAAGDMARRAGDYNRAAKYDASAPSAQECFVEGVTKGSSYKVGGWINTTTTAKCVKR